MERRSFIKLGGGSTMLLMFAPYRAFNLEEVLDNLIIGSGYGSSVAALRLAENGQKVTILEMGLDWDNNADAETPFSSVAFAKKNSTWLSTQSKAPFFNIFFFKKYTGVLDRWDFEDLKIYMGRGVGGGSLVNGGMAVTPKRSYFEEMLPQLNSEEFYNKYFPIANSTLGVNVIREDYYNTTPYYKFSRVGKAEAHKTGYNTIRVPNVYDFSYMEKEENDDVPKSALAQEVIYGNNHGKKDLTKTYLKQARETGNLTIYDLHRVDSVTENTDGTYNVAVSIITTSGEVAAEKTFKTKRLFLGAGTMGTTQLLLKARKEGTLSRLDNNLGQDWGNNGNIMSGRSFVNTLFNQVDTGKDDGIGMGAKQSTIPVDGIDNWEDPERPYFVEIAPFPMGIQNNAALYLQINKVPTPGKIIYSDDNQYGVQPVWNSVNFGHMQKNTEHFLGKMIETNGGSKTALFSGGMNHEICYHPLGGCVIGKATDLAGRVNNYKNLYVIDGSLIPASIGVNPFVTITAIAEHNIEQIIAEDIQTTGIKSFFAPEKKNIVLAYPSVVSDQKSIHIIASEINSIEVIDIQGKQHRNITNLPIQSGYELNVEGLAPGTYIVHINKQHQTKFVVN